MIGHNRVMTIAATAPQPGAPLSRPSCYGSEDRRRLRRRRRPINRAIATFIGGIAALAAVPAAAQDWPTRPVTMVVPFAAGSGSDILGRIIAPRLGAQLGATVIVEDVGGAGGMIGRGPGDEGGARRLFAPARHRRHPCDQPDALQEAALQRRHRFRAGRPGGQHADSAGHAPGLAGRQPAGVHRLCEGQPGHHAVRLARRRLDLASGLRPVQRGDRGADHPCSLSQHRAGAAGSAGGAARLPVRPDRRRGAADRGQADQGDRDHVEATLGDPADAGNRRRSRASPISQSRPGTRSSCRRARPPPSSASCMPPRSPP